MHLACWQTDTPDRRSFVSFVRASERARERAYVCILVCMCECVSVRVFFLNTLFLQFILNTRANYSVNQLLRTHRVNSKCVDAEITSNEIKHIRQVSRIIVFEERCRHDLVCRPQQIAIDAKTTAFLQSLGVDFDNIEGCREKGCFFTRAGVFLEYMLSIIQRLDVPIDLRLNCKVGLHRRAFVTYTLAFVS